VRHGTGYPFPRCAFLAIPLPVENLLGPLFPRVLLRLHRPPLIPLSALTPAPLQYRNCGQSDRKRVQPRHQLARLGYDLAHGTAGKRPSSNPSNQARSKKQKWSDQAVLAPATSVMGVLLEPSERERERASAREIQREWETERVETEGRFSLHFALRLHLWA